MQYENQPFVRDSSKSVKCQRENRFLERICTKCDGKIWWNESNKDEGQTDQRNFVLKKAIVEVMEGDTEKTVKVLKVIEIYDTNSFEGGLMF